MTRAALALVLYAGAAMAGPDDFAPDFEVLFQSRAADVQVAQPGVAVLELPGPVLVSRYSRGAKPSYRAEDQSGRGALLCALDGLLALAALAVKCPDLLDEGEKTRLETRLRRVARALADQTVPQVPQSDVDRRLIALLRSRVDAAVCPSQGAEQGDSLVMARSVLRADNPAIDRLLGVPRLPVAHPCP